eukprot:774914-Ditylum_brightwellii.AAC.1
MLLMTNLQKHYKRCDVRKGSKFDPPAIPFISKATILKMENEQEFNLHVSPMSKQSTCKFKAHTFSNGMAKYVLKWEKRLAIEFKRIKIVWIPKNPDGTDGVAPGISMDTYKACLGLLKKQYFPQNAA